MSAAGRRGKESEARGNRPSYPPEPAAAERRKIMNGELRVRLYGCYIPLPIKEVKSWP